MREIIVKSAIALTEEQKAKLEAGLRAADPQSELRFRYQIDRIVGGIVVIDGEDVYDASIAAELRKLKKSSDRLVHHGKDGKGIAVQDIPALLKSKLDEMIDHKHDYEVCGKVIAAADGVIRIEGLQDCRYGELLLVGTHGFALAMNLEETEVGAILLSEIDTAEYGDFVYTTGKIVEVPVGDELLGRVVNPLGQPMDGGDAIKGETTRCVESPAPAIIDRQKVSEPLQTGILAVDAMIPIGKGQRELIIGDRQTGKTSLAIDTILNQKGKDVLCIYVAIGQRASSVGKIVRTLKAHGAMDYTTIVLSTADDSAPLQYLAPYTGAAIGEHWMEEGKDVLIVYDDLSKHAVAYRAISLLLKRPAGREAYPGDVFYIHSRLLERAARMADEKGGGSMTALPIIETLAGDISAYIPTNVISITDGQIYLESELFHSGVRPAINVGLSVSRVGGQAQIPYIRKISSALRLKIAHYRELAVFSQFGSSLGDATKEILDDGAKTVEALKQGEGQPMSAFREAVSLYATVKGHLKSIPVSKVNAFLEGLYRYISTTMPELQRSLKDRGTFDHREEARLETAVSAFAKQFGAQ